MLFRLSCGIWQEHGIKPLAPEKARGTLEIPEYKEKRRQADELAEQNTHVEAELLEKQAKSEKLDAQIEKKTATVSHLIYAENILSYSKLYHSLHNKSTIITSIIYAF